MRNCIRSSLAMLALIAGIRGVPAATVSAIWSPSPSQGVLGYRVYYGTASGRYTTNLAVGDVTNAVVSGLANGTTYYFALTTYDGAGDESGFSTEVSYSVPPGPNQPPTLNPIANLAINENAGAQTVNLSGITTGTGSGSQVLTIAAASSNPALIPAPAVNYVSPNTNGTLSFAPALDAYGTAAITVTASNAAASNNLVSETFTVTVNAVNQPPTLNPIGNLTIEENADKQAVPLTGITSGAPNELQTLVVTAVSSNPRLIKPSISYSSPNSTGTLSFQPATGGAGVATVTVTVNDGGLSNNVVSRSFTVDVLALTRNSAPIAAIVGSRQATLNLTSQTFGPGGQFSFAVAGVSGRRYVVQTSADLIHWTSVQTNSSPFTVVDTNAGAVARQYYRACSLP